MVLTAEQQLKVALLYEKAASDRLGVPPQQRAAFSRKAKWFRMKARISAKKEAASALRAHRQKVRDEDKPLRSAEADRSTLNGTATHPVGPCRHGLIGDDARLVEMDGDAASAAPRYRSIAERITAAGPTRS
jgi:hypothetical protein